MIILWPFAFLTKPIATKKDRKRIRAAGCFDRLVNLKSVDFYAEISKSGRFKNRVSLNSRGPVSTVLC